MHMDLFTLSIVWLGQTLKFPDPLLLKLASNVLISIQDVLQISLFGNNSPRDTLCTNKESTALGDIDSYRFFKLI